MLTLIVAVLIAALLLYLVQVIPMEAWVAIVLRVAIVVVLILWLVRWYFPAAVGF